MRLDYVVVANSYQRCQLTLVANLYTAFTAVVVLPSYDKGPKHNHQSILRSLQQTVSFHLLGSKSQTSLMGLAHSPRDILLGVNLEMDWHIPLLSSSLLLSPSAVETVSQTSLHFHCYCISRSFTSHSFTYCCADLRKCTLRASSLH